MKLPVISELRAKSGKSDAINYIVNYIKQLVDVLQKEFDKSSKTEETVYVTDVRVSSGKIIISYSNENEQVFNL